MIPALLILGLVFLLTQTNPRGPELSRRSLAALFFAVVVMLSFGATRARAQSGRTFYIDYASGSNANPGTQGSPWKTHPFMHNGTTCDGGTGPSYTHQTGDRFIFKGGSTWPADCFEIFIPAGGTAASPDYYGVCLSTDSASPCFGGTSWPSTAWTRPLFDFNFQFPSLGNNAIVSSGAGAFTPGVPYLTFDNLEIAHQNMHPSPSDIQAGAAMKLGGAVNTNAAVGVTVENMYIRDWVSTDNNSGSPFNTTSYGAVYGATLFTLTETSGANSYYFIGGIKKNEVSGGGCVGCVEMSYSKVHDGWVGCESCFSTHDTEFYHIQGGVDVGIHTHIIYEGSTSGFQTAFYAYNNYLHDNQPGLQINMYYYSSVFNNILANAPQNAIYLYRNCPGCATATDSSAKVGYVLNNTIEVVGPGSCYAWYGPGGTGLGTLFWKNNICIPTNGAVGGFSVTSIPSPVNYTMTGSEPATYGFTAATKYKPFGVDPNVAGQGANLTSFCSGVLANVCKDTSGAPWFGGSYIDRPPKPDLGAFQGQGGATGPPVCSITSPANGATVSGSSQSLTATCTPQSPATIASIQFSIDGNTFKPAGSSSPYTVTFDTTTHANGPGVVIGVVGTDSNGQTGPARVTVTVNNSIPGCFISGDNDTDTFSWLNQAFTAQSANFSATLTVTPFTNNQDTVVPLSQGVLNSYGQAAALVRFNSSGQIDVYKGNAGYTFDNLATYTASTTYSLTYTVNFTGANAGTYSVAETSPSSIAIATNYAFRMGAPAASLGVLSAISDNTTPDTAKICGFQVSGGTSLTISPTSFDFGSVVDTTTVSKTFAVTSSGGNTTFTSVTVAGNADFSLFSENCTPSPNASCSPVVHFTPTGVGLETGTLTLVDSATGSPHIVPLQGTGVAPGPTFSLSQNTLNLGLALINKSPVTAGPVTIAVTNGPSTGSGFTITGTNAPDFALASNTWTGSVATSAQSIVSFMPSTLGAETATLCYTSGNATSSAPCVALSGTGVTTIPVSPGPQTFMASVSKTLAVPIAINGIPLGTVPFQAKIDFTCTGCDAVKQTCATCVPQ